jgi:hypothetical protein
MAVIYADIFQHELLCSLCEDKRCGWITEHGERLFAHAPGQHAPGQLIFPNVTRQRVFPNDPGQRMFPHATGLTGVAHTLPASMLRKLANGQCPIALM